MAEPRNDVAITQFRLLPTRVPLATPDNFGAMPDLHNEFVHAENMGRLRRQLAAETNVAKRQVLRGVARRRSRQDAEVQCDTAPKESSPVRRPPGSRAYRPKSLRSALWNAFRI